MRRSAWYDRVSDGRAPGPVKLGGRMALWPEDEIEGWQKSVRANGERVNTYPVREPDS